MYSSTHSLTSALDGGEWLASRPSRFSPTERTPGTHWVGGWAGPRAILDAVVKRKIPSPRPESNLGAPIIHPGAQRYTDWAITALSPLGFPIPIFHSLHICPWLTTLAKPRQLLLYSFLCHPYTSSFLGSHGILFSNTEHSWGFISRKTRSFAE
jgi:hypothetical protein